VSAKDFAISYPTLIHSSYFPCCEKYSNKYLASKVASVLQYKIITCIIGKKYMQVGSYYLRSIWLGKFKFVNF